MKIGSTGPRDSYDDIARNSTGGEAAAVRAAQRRHGAAPEQREGAGDPALDVHPEDVTAKARGLSALRARVRAPGVSAASLRALRERTDRHVAFVSQQVADLLRAYPKVAAVAREAPEAQEARIRQRTEALLLRGTARALRIAATDSRRQTSGALRQGLRELAAQIRADLQPGARPREEQAQLASDAQEFLGLWDSAQAAPLLERERTLREGAEHDEALSAEAAEARYLRAIIALGNGEAVEPEAWDEAAARFTASAAEAATAAAPAVTTTRRSQALPAAPAAPARSDRRGRGR